MQRSCVLLNGQSDFIIQGDYSERLRLWRSAGQAWSTLSYFLDEIEGLFNFALRGDGDLEA